MSAIRISIADDSESTRLIYKRVLETQSEFEVVGLAADGEEALEQAMALVPDVVVLDIVMPKMNGIQRSEEHTSELQSQAYLVCRLLLEKKKQ